MVRDVVVLLPGPALVGPPFAPSVAAALDEPHPRAVRHGSAGDAECGHVDGVRRALVVIGEPGAARAHHEGTGGDRRPLCFVLAEPRQRRLAGREQAPERHRLAHRLRVLQLVAEDHFVQHRVGLAVPQLSGHTVANGIEIRAGARRVEQLDRAAHSPGRLEGVVAHREIGAQQRLAGEAMHEPQVLVGGDVRQVPDERAHDRVDLALEIVGREVRDEVVRPRANVRHRVEGGIGRRRSHHGG
jgi:hypothetical protein